MKTKWTMNLRERTATIARAVNLGATCLLEAIEGEHVMHADLAATDLHLVAGADLDVLDLQPVGHGIKGGCHGWESTKWNVGGKRAKC